MFWDKIKDAFSSEKNVDDNKEIKQVKGRFTMLVKGCKDEGSILLVEVTRPITKLKVRQRVLLQVL